MSNFNYSYPDVPVPLAEQLTSLVRQGRVEDLRAFFQECLFKGETIPQPQWADLRTAVIAAQKPIVQLLITWGARPSPDDLKAFETERQESYGDDIRLMNRCGLNLACPPREAFNTQAAPDTAKSALSRQDLIKALPEEWLKVIRQLRSNGANEAMIAGGALRDTYNGATFKDVDIFMADRMFFKRFIMKAFKDAGLQVHQQQIGYMYNLKFVSALKSNTDKFNKAAAQAESWTFVAGPDKTEYNFVILKGDLGKTIKSASKTRKSMWDHYAMGEVIRHFDIGLCQIACNGDTLRMMPAYEEDVAKKTITLVRPNATSREHLDRIVTKYPDFELCDASRAMLGKRRRKPKTMASSPYEDIAPMSSAKTGGWSGYGEPKTGYGYAKRTYDSTGYWDGY